MYSQWLTYGKFGPYYCGAEHTTLDGHEKINVLVLKKQQKELLQEKAFRVKTIDELSRQVPKKQHVFISINNEQVLSKKLAGIFAPEKALGIAFPNLNIGDFYYECYTGKDSTFLAICRKDHITAILQKYQEAHLRIVGISLGNLGASQLLGFVKESSLTTSNSTLVFDEGGIAELVPLQDKNKGHSYEINGLTLNSHNLLALAGILDYYLNEKKTLSNFLEEEIQLKQDFSQQRMFEVGLKAGLGVIFTLLLISFLLFSHYSAKIEAIQSELALGEAQKNSLLVLSEEVDKKERLVTNFSRTASRSSWYLDALGKSIPNSVLLSDLEVQPLVKNIKEKEAIHVQENLILIKGNAMNGSDFSDWLKYLEAESWTAEVVVQDYGTGKKRAMVFAIEIQIKK